MGNYQVDKNGFYGEFGGAYVPEILYKCVHDLQEAYLPIIESAEFKDEYHALLKDYVGRPSPLYLAKRMSEQYGCQLYLKREDLNHTGAHKINNTIGQILLAKKMGKTRIIAETGAGQHGVATATVCALMNMKCEVFMGATDVERQHTNVERMKMLGAEVHPVRTGNMTLSDACSEAIRDWCCHPSDTFYIVGSTMGPHPYPDLVARMQSVISEEIKWQLEEKIGRNYPDYLIAFVLNLGDGSKLTWRIAIVRIFGSIGVYCLCGHKDFGYNGLQKRMLTQGTVSSMDGNYIQIRVFSSKGLVANADHRWWKIYHADMAVVECTVADARHGIAKDYRHNLCTCLVGIFARIRVDGQCTGLCIPCIARLQESRSTYWIVIDCATSHPQQHHHGCHYCK